MSVSVSRSVTAFDKKTEKLVFEQHFAVHDFASLYARCGTPKEDPELFDVYPIKKEDFAFYATLLPASFSFDFDRFDYFLDASAV